MRINLKDKKVWYGICGAFVILLGIGTAIYFAQKETVPYTNSQARNLNGEEVLTSDAEGLADGIYEGEAEGFNGPVKTDVTVKDQRIESIEVTEHIDDEPWFKRALAYLPDEIIANQTTNVDVVSSATLSSAGIINSVKNALGQEDYIEVDRSKDKKRGDGSDHDHDDDDHDRYDKDRVDKDRYDRDRSKSKDQD